MKWKVIGGAIFAVMAASVVMNLKTIRRYIRISTM